MIDCTEEKPHHIPHKIASLAKKCKSKMNVDKLTGNPSRAMGMVFTDTLLWHCFFSASHKHILGGFPSSNNTSSYSILLRLLETWPERLLRRRDGTLNIIGHMFNPQPNGGINFYESSKICDIPGNTHRPQDPSSY